MTRSILSLIALVVTAVCFAYDPSDYKEPPKIDAVYYARAYYRNFRGFVQVHSPPDITRRQYDKKLLIEGEAAYLWQIVDTPKLIPEKSRDTISRTLTTDDSEARKQVLEGPMMGPLTAFVIFDRNREPTALVTQHAAVYVTSHLQPVSGSDTFQRVGEWLAYSGCAELTELVGIAEEPPPERKTPFQKWQREGRK